MHFYTNFLENYFSALKFEEKRHMYWVGKEVYPSVSKLISDVTPPFEEGIIAERVAKKDGISVSKVLDNWAEIREEACDRGTRVHNFAEDYAKDRTLVPSCPQEEAAKKFWDEMPDHIIPIFPELKMYHKTFKYAGTTDLVLYDTKAKSFILADYKTNKDLFKNYKDKRLLAPFANMLSTPFSKYSLQLSYYQLMFEQTGLSVSQRKLVYLDLKGNYLMYDLQDYRQEVTDYLKNAA